MNRLILAALFIAVAAAGYYLFAPSQVQKRQAQIMLDRIAAATETQKPGDVAGVLNDIITPEAQIKMEIDFPSAPTSSVKNAEAENFSRVDFLSFIDNTLYTLSDYHVSLHAQSVDTRSGMLEFTANIKANGMQMDGNIRFTGETTCRAKLHFEKNRTLIETLSCSTQLHYGMAAASH